MRGIYVSRLLKRYESTKEETKEERSVKGVFWKKRRKAGVNAMIMVNPSQSCFPRHKSIIALNSSSESKQGGQIEPDDR